MSAEAVWRPGRWPFQAWRFSLHATPLALHVTWWLWPGKPPTVQVHVQSVPHPRMFTFPSPTASELYDAVGWVTLGPFHLGPGVTRGRVDAPVPLAWDLAWTSMTSLVQPFSRGWARLWPLATRVVSYPAVRFQGEIRYGDERWEGEAWGGLSRWWGRRPPARWFWLNAPRCTETGTALEVWSARVALGRVPWPRVHVGYFWLHTAAHTWCWVHPFSGHLTVVGPPDAPRVRAVPWHGQGYTLLARAHPPTWQKPDPDRILTLTGDARVLGGAACLATALLEWRVPPVY